MPVPKKDRKAKREDRKGAKGLLPSLRRNLDDEDDAVLAIIIGDVHLRSKAPIARSNEPDWYEAMERYLRQIRDLQNEHPKADTFYVGDIFHKWDSSARLINFAIKHLPKGMCIYGQHDLPFHNPNELHHSAFWTLVRDGAVLEQLDNNTLILGTDAFSVTGFGWEDEIQPLRRDCEREINIALIHKYIWSEGFSYGKAPKSNHINAIKPLLTTYTHAFFGDNHTPFLIPHGKRPKIINCGCIMPTNKDQRNYIPNVYLVGTSGSVGYFPLDTSQDKWLTEEELEKKIGPEVELRGLLSRMAKLGSKPVNFSKVLMKLTTDKKVKKSVRNLILELLKECEE